MPFLSKRFDNIGIDINNDIELHDWSTVIALNTEFQPKYSGKCNQCDLCISYDNVLYWYNKHYNV